MEAAADTDNEATTLLGSRLLWTHKRSALLLALLVVAVAAVAVVVGVVVTTRPPSRLNLILMMSDGMGPASVTLARAFANSTMGVERLTLDDLLTGAVQTASLDVRPRGGGRVGELSLP